MEQQPRPMKFKLYFLYNIRNFSLLNANLNIVQFIFLCDYLNAEEIDLLIY